MNFSIQDQLNNIQNAISELENAIYTNPELEDALKSALDALAAKQDELMALAPEHGSCSACGAPGPAGTRYVLPDGVSPCCDGCSMARSWQYEDAGDDEEL
jgi:hypothetical protein